MVWCVCWLPQAVWLSVEDGRLFHTATVNHSPSSELFVDLSPDADALLLGSSTGIVSLIRATELQSEPKAVAANNPHPSPGSQRQARRRGGETLTLILTLTLALTQAEPSPKPSPNPNPNPNPNPGESSEAPPVKVELKLQSEVLDLTNSHAGPISGVRVMDGMTYTPRPVRIARTTVGVSLCRCVGRRSRVHLLTGEQLARERRLPKPT